MDLRDRAVSPYRGQENARKKGQSEMALRLEPFGIHVIIIEPGYFRTDSLDSSSVHYGDIDIGDYAQGATQHRAFLDNRNHQQLADNI